jgi:hypothetical protein
MQPDYSFTKNSRYGYPRTITLLDRKRGIFKVSGKSDFVRGGEGMFDFEGGPFYSIGGSFHDMGEITSVTPVQGNDGNATVLVTVKLTRSARAKIGRSIKKAKETVDVCDQADQRQGGQGSSCGSARCCGGVCRGEGGTGGCQVAQRDGEEDRVGYGVRPDSVQEEGRLADGDAEGRVHAQVERLHEDIARGKERRREAIEAKYPRVFGGGTRTVDPDRSIGTVCWEFGYGWDNLIETLALALNAEIDRDPSLSREDNPFRIVQMKEKFASLRIYSDNGNQRTEAIIRMVEKMSSGVCEVCGETGFLSRSAVGKGGWIKTLCKECCLPMQYRRVEEEEAEIP